VIPDRLKSPAIALALAVLVLAVYWQTGRHDFINVDDQQYVYDNPVVLRGLTPEGARWAFTTFHAANWHPLTWLSHMADIDLFGLDAGRHHQVNLLLHLLNTLALFLLLARTTGDALKGGFVAALFAVHPLHVESVAWVSERKDLLSTLFGFLAMHAYVRFAEKRTVARYAAVALLFALSLLSKPMLVTLPFVLLLLDYWPLRRFGRAQAAEGDSPDRFHPAPFGKLAVEKLPLLALSFGSCLMTLAAQGADGNISSFAVYPLWPRLSTVVTGYGAYLWKMAWPAGLSSFYPHPWVLGKLLPPWQTAASLAALAAISAFALRSPSRRPWLAVGWLWYLGTLVPVIGITQAGQQWMADRYAYLSLTGPFLMIAWGVPAALGRLRLPKAVPAVLAGVVVLAMTGVAYRQAAFWQDAETLCRHGVEAAPGNWFLENSLGSALLKAGRPQEALPHFEEALRIRPAFAWPHNNLGVIAWRAGQTREAIRHFRESLRIDPAAVNPLVNLCGLLAKEGRYDEAIAQCEEALRQSPGHPEARNLLENSVRERDIMAARQGGGAR
jgi:tetratricopeptide (TPR) repeat protein